MMSFVPGPIPKTSRAAVVLVLLLVAGGVRSATTPGDGETAPAAGAASLFDRPVRHMGTHEVLPDGAARAALAPSALAFGRGGYRLLIADHATSPARLRIMAPDPRGELRERGYLLGHLTAVRAVAWSDDHDLLATVGGAPEPEAERALRLWNAKAMNRKSPSLPLAYGLPSALAISPDGRFVAVGHDDGWLSLFRNRHGRQRPTERRLHDLAVGVIAFSADGEALYSGTLPGAPRPLRAWRTKDLRPLDRGQPLPAPPGAPTALLALGARGDALVVGTDAGEVLRIDLASATVRWTTRIDGAVRRIRAVGDAGELLLLSGEGSPDPVFVASETGGTSASIRARHRDAGLADAAYEPETGLLALAHTDGVVEYWRVEGAPQGERFR